MTPLEQRSVDAVDKALLKNLAGQIPGAAEAKMGGGLGGLGVDEIRLGSNPMDEVNRTLKALTAEPRAISANVHDRSALQKWNAATEGCNDTAARMATWRDNIQVALTSADGAQEYDGLRISLSYAPLTVGGTLVSRDKDQTGFFGLGRKQDWSQDCCGTRDGKSIYTLTVFYVDQAVTTLFNIPPRRRRHRRPAAQQARRRRALKPGFKLRYRVICVNRFGARARSDWLTVADRSNMIDHAHFVRGAF